MILVESIRPDVRRWDSKAAHSSAIIFELALTPRRGVCADQRRDSRILGRSASEMLGI